MAPALPPLNGFMLVHKPAGPSSAAISNHIKWMLKQQGYPKGIKIGHGGTLDPFATGLLPIGIGKATKQLQQLLDGPKTYTFTLQFGTQTDTGDLTGVPVATSPARPTEAELCAILPQLTGPILQTPPAFSALKVNGQRAYTLARAGETVALAPREITIYELKMIEYHTDYAVFSAAVSKGTYIRTLGEDIAKAAGTVGHLTTLCRTQHGPFQLVDAFLPEDVDNAIVSGHIATHLFPLLAELPAR